MTSAVATPCTNLASSTPMASTPLIPSSSRLTNRSNVLEITIVDDDILHTVSNLLGLDRTENPNDYDDLFESVSKTVQAERNHWKHRLNTAMQEIDRQHKLILSNEARVQELMDLLQVKESTDSRPEQILEDQILEDTQLAENLMETLKFKIKHLKQLAGVTDDILAKDPKETQKKYSELDIKYLKNAIAKLHWEKESAQTKMEDRDKEIEWLKGELQNTKCHLTKLQDIVTQYNVSHNGTYLQLQSMSEEKDSLSENVSKENSRQTTKHTPRPKERKYIEGDQSMSYPVGREEVAFWKSRLRSNVYSNKGGNSRTGVAQCLRCNRLFKPSNNNNKACMFHSKGREIKEIYDDNGKIVNVLYKWACCKKGLESKGCSQGFHI